MQFIHKISSFRDAPVGVELPDGAFTDRKALGAALRKAEMLCKGERVQAFRVEGNRVVVFPAKSIWHSLIITALDE